jgi:hypothetical protein
MRLTIVKGRALIGLLALERDISSSLKVHVQYESARFSTKRVMSSIEPSFGDFVDFELGVIDILTNFEV